MSLKKFLIAIPLMVLGYCAIYLIGQPFAGRSESSSHLWVTAFYPLRMALYRTVYSSVITEKGTIQQNTSGGWSLTYATPRTMAGNPYPTQGIAFRVPAHLAAAVAAAKGKPAEVTIRKEPDPKYLSSASFVLDSVTLSATK